MVSDLVRDPQGRAARHIAKIGGQGLAISVISAAELRFGGVKRGSPALLRQTEAVLVGLDILPFEVPADHAYGRIRAALEAAGTPIGPNDLPITAHALVLDVPLVTANEGEFRRVKGLRVENWLLSPLVRYRAAQRLSSWLRRYQRLYGRRTQPVSTKA